MTEIHHSYSVEETLQFARKFSRRLKPGQRVGLVGELGAGKTVFAKGMLSTLCGVPVEEIPSPTFTLIEEYPNSIYHVDLYRLDSIEDSKELAWDELLSSQAITLIEWPEKIKGLLDSCQFTVKLSREGVSSPELGGQARRIEMTERSTAYD